MCPAYEAQIGVANYPDPNEIFQKRYFVEEFADDRTAKIIGLRSCNNAGGLLFKGF